MEYFDFTCRSMINDEYFNDKEYLIKSMISLLYKMIYKTSFMCLDIHANNFMYNSETKIVKMIDFDGSYCIDTKNIENPNKDYNFIITLIIFQKKMYGVDKNFLINIIEDKFPIYKNRNNYKEEIADYIMENWKEFNEGFFRLEIMDSFNNIDKNGIEIFIKESLTFPYDLIEPINKDTKSDGKKYNKDTKSDGKKYNKDTKSYGKKYNKDNTSDGKKYKYILNKKQELILYNNNIPENYNEPIICTGDIRIKDGKIEYINNFSIKYKTTDDNLLDVLSIIKKKL